MTEPETDFERVLAARLRAHLDAGVGDVDPTAAAAAVLADADRAQPVGRPEVRWLSSPPGRWRPVAAIAAVLSVALGALLIGGNPNGPSPSPSPTSAVVVPSMGPTRLPASAAPGGLRQLNANGLLAWSKQGSVNVMAPDGGDQRVLEGLPGEDSQPAWSPDGRWIAFLNVEGETFRLGKMLADGSEAEVLAELDSAAWAPDWSPDGAWIAWTHPGRGVSRILALHLATTRVSEVAEGWDPDWSPDSRHLVYVHGRLATRLSVVEIGGRTVPLTGGGEGFIADANPDWSPTGDRILFDRHGPNGGQHDLMVIQADGTNLRELLGAGDRRADAMPVVDPFGERVTFSIGLQTDEPAGAIVGIDGANLRRFGPVPRWFGAAWSPDGQFLIAANGDAQAPVNRWIIVNSETGEREFVFEVTDASIPSWQPLPYSVSCGPMEDRACRATSIALAAFSGRLNQREKRILAVRIGSECGSHRVEFTDGTAMTGVCAAG